MEATWRVMMLEMIHRPMNVGLLQKWTPIDPAVAPSLCKPKNHCLTTMMTV